jgi:hypothetical protein
MVDKYTNRAIGGASPPVKGFVRALAMCVAAGALAAPVHAQSALQLHGKTGYLGEYELSATVSEQISNGKTEFSGPLVVKHVGLCTHTGPQEAMSQIKLQFAASSQRVTAKLVFQGIDCTYQGVLAESYHGFMDCADHTSLPIRLWTR